MRYNREFKEFISRKNLSFELYQVYSDRERAERKARKLKHRKKISKHRIIEKETENLFGKKKKYALYVH